MEKTTNPLQNQYPTFRNRTRFVILFLGLLCIICTNANYNIINFTVICMSDVIETAHSDNTTHWLENTADVSFVFSAGAFGAIAGLLPSVPLTNKLGIRNVLSLYGLLSALGTLAIPPAVHLGYIPVIIARMCQGFGSSILFSSIGSISEGWAPLAEISTYVAFLSAGFQISNIVLMPVSGILCESSLGWRWIYFFFGGFAVLVNIAFFTFFRDNASIHKNVSHKELQKIRSGREMEGKNKSRTTPYLAICKDKTILAIWASAMGGNLSLMTLITYGPTYLNKVLKLDVRDTGFSNAIPYILATFTKFISGPLSDYCTFIPETWRIISFAAISQGGMAIGYFIMAFTSSRLTAQIAYTCAIILAGINIVGVVKCAQMVARKHVHFVMAVISLSAWLSIFVLPIAIGWVCPDNAPEQWSRFFIFVGIWVIIMNIPFPFVATVDAAHYTKPEFEEAKRSQNVKIQPFKI